MLHYDNCPNCFAPIGGSPVCPHCGNDSTKNKNYAGVLPPFTLLNNKYLLGRVLGKGGFGVTYVAKDINTNRICAVKEYMPAEYSIREGSTMNVVPFTDEKAKFVFNHGRDKFIDEARTLIKLRNDPIVVDILDFFTQNNTAYLVMEYLDGSDLRQRAKINGGRLDPDFAKMVFVTVASSLMEIHKLNILHRDLSPENIIVTNNGSIKLIDFGAARNFVSTQNKGMSILLKPGFAPPEQYNSKGNQGPWSDVYALCATFYTLVSGKPLVDALFRYRGEEQPSLISLGCPVTKKTSDVIEKGMALEVRDRYKDFRDLLSEIDISVAKAPPKPSFGQQPVNNAVVQHTPPQPPVNSQQGFVNRPPQYVQPGGQQVPPNNIGNSQQGFGNRPAQFVQSNGAVSSQNQFGTQSTYMNRSPQYGQQGGQQVQPNNGVNYQQQVRRQPYVAAVIGNSLCNRVDIKTSDVFKIGRSAQSCQYTIAGDTNISRIHCYLRFDGDKIYISDASSNGTYFENGARLMKNKEYEIAPGTKFYLATRNRMLVVNV